METERYYNTPIFKDAVVCPESDCLDGYVYEAQYDDDGHFTHYEKEKCSTCKGEGTIEN